MASTPVSVDEAAAGRGEGAGEALAATGRLEADVGTYFDRQLATLDPRLDAELDPAAHATLRPEMMAIRAELRQTKVQTLVVRRAALRALLVRDALAEDCELRNLGLAYAPARQ